MGIIKHGDKFKPIICDKCNCEFEYDDVIKEVKEIHYGRYDYCVYCPECKNRIVNSSKELDICKRIKRPF